MRLAASAGRFALTGLMVTSIHAAVAITLIESLRAHPAVANGAAFLIANLLSFFANTLWSFQARLSLRVWLRFVAVSAAAWVLTMAIAWGVDRAGGHYLLGIAVVVTVVPLLSFVAHRLFTYRKIE